MNFPQFIQEFSSKKDTDELGSNSSEESQIELKEEESHGMKQPPQIKVVNEDEINTYD